MTSRHFLTILLLCAGLILAACSDDNQDQDDGGVPISKNCEARCTMQESHYCVTGKRGVCVECVTDHHCQSNAGAMGTKCTATNLCLCSTDADCAGKTHGTTCDKKLQICSCTSDSDCPAPGRCTGEMYGAKVCKNECYEDKDCTDDNAPFCDVSNGKCVGCMGDKDCAGGSSWGNKCIKGTTRTACGCKTDADCTANRYGSTCSTATGRCSCTGDAGCKKAPYTKCGPVSKSSYAMQCQKPCKSDVDCGANLTCHKSSGRCTECAADKDCKSATLKRCNLTIGKCVACKKDAECTDKSKPFCNPGSGICVECLTDATCKAGYFWGNKCIKGYSGTASCGCQASGDCAGNAHGTTCNTFARRCTCKTAAECKKAPYTRCYLSTSYSSYLHCQKACKANKDCGYGLKCDVASGMCLQCKVDKDCTSSTYKYCHQAMGKCVACKSNKDCKSATRPTCDTSGQCVECVTDKDCKTGYHYGNKCVASSTYGKVCRCHGNSDCAGNPRGPTCYAYYQRCTCSSDKQCKTKPYTMCEKPYPNSTYKYCQKPCASNADCTNSYSPYCKKSTGKCVGCLTNAECANGTRPVCDTKSGTCTGCKTDQDCAGSMYGSYCVKSLGQCSCNTDAHCKARAWGGKCVSYGTSGTKRCTCAAAADCKGNSNGPTCNTYYRRCTCKANGDCKVSPYTTCNLPYAGAYYSHCQKPCKTDSDCVLPGLSKCFLGKCIAP